LKILEVLVNLEQKDNLNERVSVAAEAEVGMYTKRILVVDDEEDLVVMISKVLGYKGYEVISANDGQEGLEKAKTEKPDLIVLDLMLPKINGYKVCGLLKKDTRYAKIPIILFTAKGNAEDMELGNRVGADAYITKPYEREVLLGKIEELLKQK
jgi:DNA-binding response OmpR family regulator